MLPGYIFLLPNSLGSPWSSSPGQAGAGSQLRLRGKIPRSSPASPSRLRRLLSALRSLRPLPAGQPG